MFIVQVSMNVLTLIRLTRLAIVSTGTMSRWTSQRPSVLTKPETPRSHTSQMSSRWSISSGRLISAVSDSIPVSASHRASSGASRLPYTAMCCLSWSRPIIDTTERYWPSSRRTM